LIDLIDNKTVGLMRFEQQGRNQKTHVLTINGLVLKFRNNGTLTLNPSLTDRVCSKR